MGRSVAIVGAISILNLRASDFTPDGFHPICGQRLREVVVGRTSISTPDVEVETASAASINAFHHFTAPTLAHLLALLCKPTTAAIPDGTALVVIDSFSALFNHAYPRNAEPKKNVKGKLMTFSICAESNFSKT